MSTSKNADSKPQQPSFSVVAAFSNESFALLERRQILCSRRWFRALKTLVGGTPCRHGVVVITVRFIGITRHGHVLASSAVYAKRAWYDSEHNSAYADNVLWS